MLHAKFHDHRTIISVGKDVMKVFTIYGHGGHPGHVTWTIYIILARSTMPHFEILHLTL